MRGGDRLAKYLITEHSERCEEIQDSQIPSAADPDDNCDDHTHSEILNL